jgi:hypothetical protein
MSDAHDTRTRRMAEVLLQDGKTLRATILHAHKNAWDASVAEGMVRKLSDRDLFCLEVIVSPLISDGDPVDAWLRGLCDAEAARREAEDDARGQVAA